MRARVFLVVAAVCTGVACGGETQPQTSPGGGAGGALGVDWHAPIPADLTRDTWATKFAEALCGTIGPCCDRSTLPYYREGCLTRVTKEQTERTKELAASSAVAFDTQAAADCLARVKLVVLQCDATRDEVQAVLQPCDEIFKGKKPIGEPCSESFECASDLCYGDLDGSAEVCEESSSSASNRGAPGEGCFLTCEHPGPGSDCGTSAGGGKPSPSPPPKPGEKTCFADEGLYCDADTYLCTQMLPLGAPCDHTDTCADARCVNKVCTAPAAEGEPCRDLTSGPLGDENLPFCKPGFYCLPGKARCVPQLPTGSDCGASFDECFSGNCENGRCAGNVLVEAKVCSG